MNSSAAPNQPDQTPSQKAFSQLGFRDVRELLAQEAHGERVSARLLALEPLDEIDLARERFAKIHALWEFWRSSAPFPLRHYESLTEILKSLRVEGGLLSVESFLILRPVLEQFRLLHRYFFQSRMEPENPWFGWFGKLTPQPKLEESIDRVISPEGFVLDNASAELRKIRHAIQRAEAAVRQEMDRLVAQYTAQGMLTDDRPTIKGGRLVLPVSSNAKRQVKGVIQDQSHTGNTTYVEPLEIIELNNKIRSLQLDEAREIERILRALTAKCHAEAAPIAQSYDALVELDFIASLATFGKRRSGSLPRVDKGIGLKLVNARNPLLSENRDVVPLNLNLDENTHTLVITGPNAGGKTVALKTIGLMVLLARCGVPIPAEEGSEIPWVDAVYSDIGDQQSILNDLSTFSAHMSALVEIVENATAESLVLLDELGTGTDPAEGGALARALLNTLTHRGTTTIATTHLGELKAYAHDTPGVGNASMEFDGERLEPTYRLRQGTPGSSYGLEISRRLGLAQEILDEARSYIGDKRGSLEALITDLEDRLQEAEQSRLEVKRLESLLKSRENEMEANLKEIRKAYKTAKRDAAREAQRLIADARKTAENLIREIRESQAEKSNIQSVRAKLQQQSRELEKLSEVAVSVAKKPLEKSQVQDGTRVQVLPLAQQGTILGKVGGSGRVMVDLGDKRMQVPLDWLALAEPASHEAEDSGAVSVTISSDRQYSSTLDMRGMRVDEAESALLRFLDQAVLANLSRVDIIHGKGTGALKQRVHELLKGHKSVQEFRVGGMDEGGAGVTIVYLE
ncbi:MAG: endonuclease MutS2 [Candidatus Marinimicrobia bacterium]|nr:endonuclease MutS2 [Candidatus Neomarinimicrobiota bacterium]MCF7840705.1 endonuclease MutS2 [Candidatus Neomarinimicrobiota bacterium]MCF7903497.1 endonuclease MutS2 [Candidatus Neomarinimicrobiota bacterium]